MVIIEYCGLPGSGKSTVASKHIKRLEIEGKRVLTEKDYLSSHSNKKNILKGLFSKCGFYYILNAFLVAIRRHVFFNYNVLIRLITNLSILSFYNEFKLNENIIVLMDQALVQRYISAFYGYCEIEEKDCRFLINILRKYSIKLVFIDVNPITAESRIIARGQKSHGRIDAENKKKQLDILQVESKNFSTLYHVMDNKDFFIRVDNNEEC